MHNHIKINNNMKGLDTETEESVTLVNITSRRRSSTLLQSKEFIKLDQQEQTEPKETLTDKIKYRKNFLIPILLLPYFLLDTITQSVLILLALLYKFIGLNEFSKNLVELCGGERVYKAKRTLLFITLDLLSDIATAYLHYKNNRVEEGHLTVGIVFISGCIVSCIVAISKMRKQNYNNFAAEHKKYRFLLYIPCLMPYYSGLVRLKYAKEYKENIENVPDEERNKYERKLANFEIGSSWDTMFETIYEGFPQALLQTILLLEMDQFVFSSDWIQLLGILISLYGITNGPLNLYANWTGEAKLIDTIFTLISKGVMLLCFAFLIMTMRLLLPGHRITSVFIAFSILFVLIDVPFLIIDGWVGRYTPIEQDIDKVQGNEKFKNSKLKKLRITYRTVDVIYIITSIGGLLAWILTTYSLGKISRRVYITGGLYIVGLICALVYLMIKNSRRVIGCCVPYFLGLFIVRIIRYTYKRLGKFEEFGNGNTLHEYIGS